MKHTCSCGTEFEGKFCPNCGAEWQEQKTCPKCGAQIAGNAKFCNNCGYAFTPQPAPKPVKPKGEKKAAAMAWVKRHKIPVIIVSAVVIIGILLAIILPITLAGSNNGTYYRYEYGQFRESEYYELSSGTWKNASGETGSYTLSGDTITLHQKVFGSDMELATGTLKDGFLKLKVLGAEMTYAKKDAVTEGGDSEGAHVHDWGDWTVTKAATCTEAGEETRTCKKDNSHTETREIKALGHDMKSFPAREVTCSQDGYEAHTGCIRCGYSEEEYKWTPALHVKYKETESGYMVSGLSEECTHTEIVLPSTYHGKPVTSIGYDAFMGCNSLTTITIPDSVTSIGSDAFSGCNSLTSITIPNSVTSIGSSAFANCSSLESVIWNAENCTKVGDYYSVLDNTIFKGCTQLTTVTFGEKVKTIPTAAFYNCNSLTTITIPDSVTEIGDYAFEGTAYYNDESNWDDGVLYIGNHLIKAQSGISGAYTVKRGTKSIASYAFYYCNYKSITIPSVTAIGRNAFYDYEGLIIFEGTVEEWKAMSGRQDSCDVQCSDGTIISREKEWEREDIRNFLLYVILPVVVGLAGIILLIVLLVRRKKKKARAQQGEDGKQENSKKKKRSKKTK